MAGLTYDIVVSDEASSKFEAIAEAADAATEAIARLNAALGDLRDADVTVHGSDHSDSAA